MLLVICKYSNWGSEDVRYQMPDVRCHPACLFHKAGFRCAQDARGITLENFQQRKSQNEIVINFQKLVSVVRVWYLKSCISCLTPSLLKKRLQQQSTFLHHNPHLQLSTRMKQFLPISHKTCLII